MPSPFNRRRRGRSRISPRLIIAAVVALGAIITYLTQTSTNPITGQKQRVALTIDKEIALGLQAAPEMAAQHGGLDPDPQAQALVDRVGQHLVAAIPRASEVYPFEFHLLADPQTINAFALPGGQIFITRALFDRLETEAQLAGVFGHEIGHVIERHGAEHLAKVRLTQGLTGAAVIASYDPDNPSSRGSAAVALLIGQMINLKYGRDDELESDRFGVRVMAEAGYDPHAMIAVMKVLASASEGNAPPEFFSTHPNPGNRIEQIEQAIREEFPEEASSGPDR